MKSWTLIFTLLFTTIAIPQSPDTDVYMFDFNYSNGKLELSNFKNISDNEGYDNQPYFLDDTFLLFSSNRGGQNDIAKYYIPYGSKVWVNFTPGSEYSPIKIPNQNAVSAIRLEQDGTQKLYKYSLSTTDSEILIDDIVIGYQLWYDEKTLVSAVLEDNGLSLYVTDLITKKHRRLDTNIGRSLQKIPNSNEVSYISKKNSNKWEIKSINIASGRQNTITTTLKDSEDFIWLNRNTLLMGKGPKLYTISTRNNSDWKEINDLKRFGIDNISRLAINDNINKLVVVGESNGAIVANPEDDKNSTPEIGNQEIEKSGVAAIIERHLRGYVNKDINAFMATFSDDVKIYDYPNKITSDGATAVKETYTNFFRRTKNLNAEVLKRMVLGNKIVDHERVTIDGNAIYAIAIYEVNNGKITRVTYIQ